MKKIAALTWVPLLASFAGCAGSAPSTIPTRPGPPPVPDLVLVWVGYGEAQRLEGGEWKRRPEYDYEFSVEQRRYADRWESVKHMRRRHPDYDGGAGPRELAYHFRLDFAATDDKGQVPLRMASSIGPGEGKADRDFRTASLVFHPALSRFAPFDTYRIEQTYDYEHGALDETVSLDKGEQPWVRNREHAVLFAPQTFAAPPTRR